MDTKTDYYHGHPACPCPECTAAFKTVCTCNGEVHDECRPCADCDQQPALNDVVDDPDGGVMYLCDDCYEERVEAEEQRINDERALTKQQQAWFDAYTGTPNR